MKIPLISNFSLSRQYSLLKSKSLGFRLLLCVLGTALLATSAMSCLFYFVLADAAQDEIVGQLNMRSRLVEEELAQTETHTIALADAVTIMHQSEIIECILARHQLKSFQIVRVFFPTFIPTKTMAMI